MRPQKRSQPSSPPSPRFFHGTSALAAVCIATDGFRLLDDPLRNWPGGALGNGIYITASLSMSAFYSCGYIIGVDLAPGTRILHLDQPHDPRVIDSLRREFGEAILRPEFEKSIPNNKQLRNTELIHLLNYLWTRGTRDRERGLFIFSHEVASLRRYLRKFHYAALGCPDSDIGIVVFNPSHLVPTQIRRMPDSPPARNDTQLPRDAWPQLVEANPSALATTAASDLNALAKTAENLRTTLAQHSPDDTRWSIEHDRQQLAAITSEYPRWQECLRRYRERFHLPTSSP